MDKKIDPYPDDLEWRTRRAINLLGASGIVFFKAKVSDGVVRESKSSGISSGWETDEELRMGLSEIFLGREQVCGKTLKFLCAEVISGWASTSRSGEDFLTIEASVGERRGVVRTASDQVIFECEADISIGQSPEFWIEWAAEDWLNHGYANFSGWASDSWKGERGTLYEILESEMDSNYLTQDLYMSELDDPLYDKALERLWALEDEGKDLEFFQNEIAPHLFMYVMSRKHPKTVNDMKAWAEHAGYPKKKIEERLLRCLGSVPQPLPLSRQQRRATDRAGRKAQR